MFNVPEQFRITSKRNPYATTKEDGNNGAFAIQKPKKTVYGLRDRHGKLKKSRQGGKATLYLCLASDGGGWEHVSVSLPLEKRTPSWSEMCDLKAMFWDAEDTVLQFHPAEKDYVDNHPRTLHLWRPVDQHIPTPPPEMVGVKNLGNLEK